MSQEREDLLASVRSRLREPAPVEIPEPNRGNPGGVPSATTRPIPPAASPGMPAGKTEVGAVAAVARTIPRPPGDSEPSPLVVGIDFGTSRSAICASNGRRATLPTLVGWPKDPVARRFINKDIVFGDEVITKRMSLDLCSPVDGGVIPLDEPGGNGGVRRTLGGTKPGEKPRTQLAAAEFLKHLVQLVGPQPGQKVHATIGTPAQIPATHRQALIEAASAAVDRIYLTTEPFAVAYSLESLNHVLVVDIGAGTTDLCRVHGSLSDEGDLRTLREAGNFVDQTLFNLLRQRHDKAQFTLRQVRQYKERFSTVAPCAEPILVTFPVNGRPTACDITEELRKACSTLVHPIVNAILDLVGSYDPEFQAELKSNIWLAGGGSFINGLPKAIETGLSPLGPGVRVQRVEDPVFAGADGALRLAQTMPLELWMVPA